MFVLEGGQVRVRREDESHSIDSRVEVVKGLYPEPMRELVHLTVRVDSDMMRGSGVSVQQPFASAIGIGPGDRRRFETNESTHVLVSWPLSASQGPSLGSIRVLVGSVGAGIDDELVLTFDLSSGTASARRVRSLDADVSSLTGLAIEPGSELQALADSIGCPLESVRRILLRRGERRVLAALPSPEESTDSDEAYSILLDVFSD